MIKGIDVSKHQGKIDWEKVKAAGIEFAIIRCGYGGNYKKQDDPQFARNVAECKRLGIPFGVYLYSYADTVEKAKAEAAHCKRLIEGLEFDFPVFYDLEDDETTGKCSNATILKIAKAFVDGMKPKTTGIYANKYWRENKLTDKWYDTVPFWLAHYATKTTYKGHYDIWQYSDKGKVDGIEGNCDMNNCYTDYIKSAPSTTPAPAEKPVEKPKDTPKQKTGVAESFDSKYRNGKAFTVNAIAGLNLRDAAKTGKVITIMPYKAKVMWYGYYTNVNGTMWRYVEYKHNGRTFVGFCCSKYLK